MTRTELSSSVAKQLKVRGEVVDAIIETAFDAIALELVRGGVVRIRGFGKFWLKTYPPRRHWNRPLGRMALLPRRRQVMFTPGQQLRSDVYGVPDAS